MSAVVGIVRLDGRPAEAAELYRMVDAMPHRCPDGRGVWVEGAVGLGHGMLHTTLESLVESLPVTSEDGRYTLTAHARVDNRQELLPLLGLDAAAPDSAVLLAAYQTWGEGCLNRLVGDFVFAVWDEEVERLFVARDQMGQHPVHYVHLPGKLFAFATEIKALLTLPEVPARLNEVKVADYLSGMREDPEGTIYEGILRLPAAHHLTVGPSGELRLERYYTLGPDPSVRGLSDEEYQARFRELFTEAVRCRLRSAFPVGSQLSGGLDSSSVTCVARDLLRQEPGLAPAPIQTFSIEFPETTSCDERPYIEAVLEGGDLEPHYVDGDAVGPLSNIPEVYEGLDDHLVGGTQHLAWALLKEARRQGVRVLLDGLDGDTTVSHGHLYLKELARAGNWDRFHHEVVYLGRRIQGTDHRQGLEHELDSAQMLLRRYAFPEVEAHAENGRRVAFARAVWGLRRTFGLPAAYLLRRHGRRAFAPRWLRRWRPRPAPATAPANPTSLVDPILAARVGLRERLEHFDRVAGLRFERVRDLQQQALASGRLVAGFEMTHHVAALHGIDNRHPFMDRRLVEFCLAMPPEQSLRDGWMRYVLRAALASHLPAEIAWRPGKADLSPSAERGLFDLDGDLLADEVADLAPLEGVVDRDAVRKMHRQGRSLSEREQTKLTQVVTLSMWLRQRFPSLAQPEMDRENSAPSHRAAAHQIAPKAHV